MYLFQYWYVAFTCIQDIRNSRCLVEVSSVLPCPSPFSSRHLRVLSIDFVEILGRLYFSNKYAQIEDFIMRTGADPAEARFFIEAAGGDVQAAATMFLESFPENMAHPGAQQHMNWDDGPQGVNHADDTATFQDVTQVADGNARGGGPVSTAVTYALSAPFLVIRGGFALVGAVLGLGWAVVNQVGTFLIGESNMAPLRRVVASLVAATGPTDPNHSARSFIASFESRFGPSRPPFEPVGCRAAIRKAHQQGKFLLVYLHDSNVSESVRFAETTLTDETIVSLIRCLPALFRSLHHVSPGLRLFLVPRLVPRAPRPAPTLSIFSLFLRALFFSPF